MEDDSSVSSSSTELSPTSSSSCNSKRKAGRKKFRETRHPVYRGVRERKGGKWVCEVREPNSKSRIWLGTYPTPEMAARAHDVAAIALRGKSAQLNFPSSASALPLPKSASPDDIRCAATEAAEMYRSGTPPPRPSSSKEQEGAGDPAASVYVDEEELFNMPSLLDSMAEGMLLTPPGVKKGLDWDAVELHTDLSLWND